MSLEYNKNLIPLAKSLRKAMTPHEKHLWYDFLRTYTIRFQRQKTIGNYIADFYCHKAHLIVELDGSQHFSESGLTYDEKRTKQLESLGIQLIRFTNLAVDTQFKAVCICIDETVKNALAPEQTKLQT